MYTAEEAVLRKTHPVFKTSAVAGRWLIGRAVTIWLSTDHALIYMLFRIFRRPAVPSTTSPHIHQLLFCRFLALAQLLVPRTLQVDAMRSLWTPMLYTQVHGAVDSD